MASTGSGFVERQIWDLFYTMGPARVTIVTMKIKKWKLKIKWFNNNFITKTKTIEDWKSKLKFDKLIFSMQQHRTFCESRVSFETEVSQQWSIERFAVLKFITTAKDGGRDLCQFWFSVWVSDLDLRRDQIENANFVHLTLFVIYWKMCTNSISGHHLQMAQGVARIDRTTPLSSFRKPKETRIPLILN